MKESKVLIFRNSVIKHMREQNYNINQPTSGKNTFTVFPPNGIDFVIIFKKKFLLIANTFELNNENREKLLEFVNELNSESLRMKFSLEEDDILILDTKLPNIYQKKEFQNVLDDIGYDMNELMIGRELLGEMFQ